MLRIFILFIAGLKERSVASPTKEFKLNFVARPGTFFEPELVNIEFLIWVD